MSEIENKISQLEKDVDWFYSADFKLDEASNKYQETLKLGKEIEQDLDNLKNEIELI